MANIQDTSYAQGVQAVKDSPSDYGLRVLNPAIVIQESIPEAGTFSTGAGVYNLAEDVILSATANPEL